VKKPALDQVRLGRAAHADGDVGLAHGEVQFLVGEHQLDADIRVEVEELGDALRQPRGAQPHRRRHPQVAGGALAGLDETGAGVLQPELHVAGGAEQQVALLGQDQAAGMPVEQRRLQFALEGADLPADRRLAESDVIARPREAAGFRDVEENPDLVPIQGRHSRPSRSARRGQPITGDHDLRALHDASLLPRRARRKGVLA
jgi:hypothetical protein